MSHRKPRGRWPLLVWFTSTERIMTRKEQAEAIRKLHVEQLAPQPRRLPPTRLPAAEVPADHLRVFLRWRRGAA